MIVKTLTLTNKLGLHARAAAKFVNETSHYAADIDVVKGEQRVNGKSIMGVMMLAASHGAELELHIDGEDEAEMFEGLKNLIDNRFGEDE